jgi:acetolactate synthase-1/2/3 large subunit
MTNLTGGDAVYETLVAAGVDHVFGIVSVHNIPIYDAILRGGKIKTIDVRHEQGALHAADGYSRATGKLVSAAPKARLFGADFCWVKDPGYPA